MEKLHTQNLLKICFYLSLAALGSAFVAEYVFGLKPCALCTYQRYAYMGMVALSAGVFATPLKSHLNLLKSIIGLTALNASIATYQVLVEKGIVETPAFCKATQLNTQSFDAFKEALKTQTVPPCNEIAFSFWGISMAGYNALFCTSLAIGLILLLRQNKEAS